ncbi:hypothetical protein [Sporosarcina sp. FSL K6-5500]|uniref:hypothetical protein n=1 Tax=Sporosarcina sp. FSL K6-5500 TaxID=2921558 RepID=UPI0030FC5384
MAKTLLGTTTEVISYHKALKFINDQGKVSNDTIGMAIVLSGLSAVTTWFTKGLAPVLVQSLGLAGITATLTTLFNDLTNNYRAKLTEVVNKIKPGESIKIVTRAYENVSGSGNSWWLSTEYTITIV